MLQWCITKRVKDVFVLSAFARKVTPSSPICQRARWKREHQAHAQHTLLKLKSNSSSVSLVFKNRLMSFKSFLSRFWLCSDSFFASMLVFRNYIRSIRYLQQTTQNKRLAWDNLLPIDHRICIPSRDLSNNTQGPTFSVTITNLRAQCKQRKRVFDWTKPDNCKRAISCREALCVTQFPTFGILLFATLAEQQHENDGMWLQRYCLLLCEFSNLRKVV